MDNKFLFLVFVFFLVFGIFASAVFYDQTTGFSTRAANQNCDVDASKSFIVSIPKDVPAGDACEVSVFTRCADETTVAGADVKLNVTNGTVDLPNGSVTDEGGRAAFAVTPNGLAEITAVINNSIQLEQTVTCNSL